MKMNAKPVPVNPAPVFPSGGMEDRDDLLQEPMLGETPLGNMSSADGDNPSVEIMPPGEPYMCESQKVRALVSGNPIAAKPGA